MTDIIKLAKECGIKFHSPKFTPGDCNNHIGFNCSCMESIAQITEAELESFAAELTKQQTALDLLRRK